MTSRLMLTLSATVAIALFLWFSASWARFAIVPYIVTVNFALMGWAWFVFDVHRFSLDSRWFDLATFEKGGHIYRFAGLHWFQAIQKFLGWNKLLGVPKIRMDKDMLERFEHGMRFGEATHWVCLAVLLPIAGWSVISQDGAGLIYWVLSAIVLHIYPIMLQRYNRPRVRRLLAKLTTRQSHLNETDGHQIQIES